MASRDTTADDTTATTADNTGLDPALLKLAGILLIGLVAVVLDTTIANVAIGTLGHSLHASVSATQWVITGFALAMAMVVPISGWAAARIGAKRMWLLSLALFLLASVLAGLAPNMGMLIAFRVLQGIGGGLMTPIMQTLLIGAAGGRPLGRLMAMISMPVLIGPILGPVIGGLIISHLSWRWIFYVNVPFCVVGLVLAWRGMPATPPRPAQRLDVVGLAMLSPAVAALVYGLSEVGVRHGFGHPSVLAPLAVGVALLVGYVGYALRGPGPAVVDVRLFGHRAFSASSALLFVSGLALYGAMLLLPLYYQLERGQSALAAGLLLVPQGVGLLATRGLAGGLTDRVGARPVVLAGFVLAALGTLAFAYAGPHTSEVLLSASLVVRGAGLGAVTIPVMASAYQGLRPAQLPDASSATRIMMQLGGSFGSAVMAMILQTQLTAHYRPDIAFQHAFWWSVGLTAAGVLPALVLPGKPGAQRRTAESAQSD